MSYVKITPICFIKHQVSVIRTESSINQSSELSAILIYNSHLFILNEYNVTESNRIELKLADFSIYNEDISVVDPSGVQLSGLSNYKNSFSFLQTIVRFFYNTKESEVQSRMIYDFARQSIRISWNAVVVPKIVGNRRNALYVDGISVYKMDSSSGKIIEHRVEKMLINNIPVQPPLGVLTALRDELLMPMGERIPTNAGIPVGAMVELLD